MSSATSVDPSAAVKELVSGTTEIEQLLIHSQELYGRIAEVSQATESTNQEKEWLLTELRNTLRSVDWDLDDLSETLTSVDRNPAKYGLNKQDLVERRRFVNDSKNLIQDIRERMSGADPRFKDRNTVMSATPIMSSNPYRYSRLMENEGSQSPSNFVSNTLEQQQLIMRNQDENLDRVGDSVHVLKTMSHRIGDELDEQAVMLDELGHDMDRTDSKLDNVMKKIAKVSHLSDDRRQCTAIIVLIGVLIFVLFLFFIL